MHEHAIGNENNFSQVKKRQISDEQICKFESYAAEIFTALGLNLNTEATRETPSRFIKALIEATEGYDGDAKLVKVFETECRGGPDCHLSQIIEGPIYFFRAMRTSLPAVLRRGLCRLYLA